MSYSKKDLYGIYFDIESNHILNEDECVVFIPTATVKTEFHQRVKQRVVKQKTTPTTSNLTISNPRTMLRQTTSDLTTANPRTMLRQTTIPKIVNQNFIQNFTQNFMRITFCIFMTIILCN
jgi:hypothetical protein